MTRSWLGAHGVDSGDTGEPCADEHPLIKAARLVQEDLVILQHIDGAWVLTAGVVCFPSHWSVADLRI